VKLLLWFSSHFGEAMLLAHFLILHMTGRKHKHELPHFTKDGKIAVILSHRMLLKNMPWM
jgi:hypothetical protein